MEEKPNKYGIMIETYDDIDYVVYEGVGLAIQHVQDYEIEFKNLTPEQLVWIWLEEIEKLDESKLDKKHKDVLKEIKNILNSEKREDKTN